MTFLIFADVMGRIGRRGLGVIIPRWREQYKADIVIANAENLAHGLGMTERTLDDIRRAGVDLFTGGNHTWDKLEGDTLLNDTSIPMVRPANYPKSKSGRGYLTYDVGGKSILLTNFIGRVYMGDPVGSPFTVADTVLGAHDLKEFAAVLVDFHAEATSEKVAFGWHMNGRASVVWGSHTNVPTADEQILPGGTAYISDVGMVGAAQSVIGVDKDVILRGFVTESRVPHPIAEEGLCEVNAIVVDVHSSTRKATRITRLREIVEVR